MQLLDSFWYRTIVKIANGQPIAKLRTLSSSHSIVKYGKHLRKGNSKTYQHQFHIIKFSCSSPQMFFSFQAPFWFTSGRCRINESWNREKGFEIIKINIIHGIFKSQLSGADAHSRTMKKPLIKCKAFLYLKFQNYDFRQSPFLFQTCQLFLLWRTMRWTQQIPGWL